MLTQLGVAPLFTEELSFTLSNGRGCNVTIKAKNTNPSYRYELDLMESEVRSKGLIAGPWAKLYGRCGSAVVVQLNHAEPDGRAVACEMTFGCDQERQYKFYLKKYRLPTTSPAIPVSTHWKNFPTNSNNWTEKKTVDLGDVSKLF